MGEAASRPKSRPRSSRPSSQPRRPARAPDWGSARSTVSCSSPGGHIAIESVEGQGTTATLYFPRVRAPSKWVQASGCKSHPAIAPARSNRSSHLSDAAAHNRWRLGVIATHWRRAPKNCSHRGGRRKLHKHRHHPMTAPTGRLSRGSARTGLSWGLIRSPRMPSVGLRTACMTLDFLQTLTAQKLPLTRIAKYEISFQAMERPAGRALD